MDANAFRYLLIALASSVVVFLNFPWRSTARSISRCAAAIAAPPPPAPVERSRRGFTASPGRLPWREMAPPRQGALAAILTTPARRTRTKRDKFRI